MLLDLAGWQGAATLLDQALGAGLATVLRLADDIAIALGVAGATAHAAGRPVGPVGHDAVFGQVGGRGYILATYLAAGLHAIVLGEEIVAIAAAAAVGEGLAAIGVSIVGVALIVAAARARLWLLHAYFLGLLHVDVAVQGVLAFFLLMQLEPLGAIILHRAIFQQHQTFAYGATKSTYTRARTPVTPLGGRTIGIGQFHLFVCALRSHALVLLHNGDVRTTFASLWTNKSARAHGNANAAAGRALRPHAPGCGSTDASAFAIVVDQ